jgi:hypothetical protein
MNGAGGNEDLTQFQTNINNKGTDNLNLNL